MRIYSKYMDAIIELDGYETIGGKAVVYHNALYRFIMDRNMIKVDFQFVSCTDDSAVVMCDIQDTMGKQTYGIGEVHGVTDAPATKALNIAFDKACIEFLGIRCSTNILENQENVPREPGEVVLESGIFMTNRMTVKKAFEEAGKNQFIKNALDEMMRMKPYEVADKLLQKEAEAVIGYSILLKDKKPERQEKKPEQQEKKKTQQDKQKIDCKDYRPSFGKFAADKEYAGMTVAVFFEKAESGKEEYKYLMECLNMDVSKSQKDIKFGITAMKKYLVDGYMLSYGVFGQEREQFHLTAKAAFEQAKSNNQLRASIQMYLSADMENAQTAKEKISLMALKYQSMIGG